MDVEKTVEFLLEQQASFASKMGELRDQQAVFASQMTALGEKMTALGTVVHELAVNQVALGKAQTRTDETVRQLGQRVDRLVEALENRFGSNGTGT